MAYLLVREGNDQGRQIALGRERVSVGRGLRNNLRLADETVSRRHAVVEYEAGGHTLVDLSSTNGSYINGKRVGERRRLKPGDRIVLGRTSLVYQAGSRVPVEQEAPTAQEPRAGRKAGR
ncbi:MAG: FHA domain-containing protein [Symbiobacteriia bacterium]